MDREYFQDSGCGRWEWWWRPLRPSLCLKTLTPPPLIASIPILKSWGDPLCFQQSCGDSPLPSWLPRVQLLISRKEQQAQMEMLHLGVPGTAKNFSRSEISNFFSLLMKEQAVNIVICENRMVSRTSVWLCCGRQELVWAFFWHCAGLGLWVVASQPFLQSQQLSPLHQQPQNSIALFSKFPVTLNTFSPLLCAHRV